MNDGAENEPDETGGANTISFNMAKEYYQQCGASHEDYKDLVRKPTKEEMGQ